MENGTLQTPRLSMRFNMQDLPELPIELPEGPVPEAQRRFVTCCNEDKEGISMQKHAETTNLLVCCHCVCSQILKMSFQNVP